MKAIICGGLVLPLGDDARISRIDKDHCIFRVKKGVMDGKLIKFAAVGNIAILTNDGDEWQVLVNTGLVEWEE